MPITVPTERALTRPSRLLHDHVAASAAFQDRVSGDAESSVYFSYALDDNVDNLAPCAVISHGNNWDWRTTSGGDLNNLMNQGQLTLILYAVGEFPASDMKNDYLDFSEWAGAVIEDVIALAGVSDNLNLTSVSLLEEPTVTNPKKQASNNGRNVWRVAFGMGYNETD